MRRASVFLGALAMFAALAGCDQDEGLTIKRVEPRTGTHHGGELVTIHGTGFQSAGATGVTIYFGEREIRPQQIVGDRQIIIKTPPGPRDATVDIQLVFDDARQFLYKDAFTYRERSEGFGVDELVTGEQGSDD
jgi:hypothetical protein